MERIRKQGVDLRSTRYQKSEQDFPVDNIGGSWFLDLCIDLT